MLEFAHLRPLLQRAAQITPQLEHQPQRANNGSGGGMVFAGDRFVAAGWRTNATVLLPDAGRFAGTYGGDHPNLYDDAGIAPWFTGLGAGQL